MPEVKTLAEMAGEGLREAGILIAVFAWLDKTVQGEPFLGPFAWATLAASVALFTAGVVIERRRAAD
jgi:hypothetical protein